MLIDFHSFSVKFVTECSLTVYTRWHGQSYRWPGEEHSWSDDPGWSGWPSIDHHSLSCYQAISLQRDIFS